MPKEINEYDVELDEAMDTKDFAKFLAKNKEGSVDIDNKEVMQGHLKTFESLTIVKKEYKDLCREKLQNELGIKLYDGDMEAIDDYVEKISIDDPERLHELHEKIDTQQRLAGNISYLEGKLENLEEKKNSAEGFMKKAGMFILDRTYGSILRGAKGFVEGGESNLKSELLTEIASIGNLHDKIKKRVATQLNRMFRNADSTDELNVLQERMEFLVNAQGDEGAKLELISEQDEETLQQKIDEAIEIKSGEEILKAVNEMTLEQGAFSELETTLGNYLEKKKFGSREDEDARELILSTMEQTSKKLGRGIEGRAKKFMLLRIIQKARA